jgi:Carbohydrate family 9 binding domain-like
MPLRQQGYLGNDRRQALVDRPRRVCCMSARFRYLLAAGVLATLTAAFDAQAQPTAPLEDDRPTLAARRRSAPVTIDGHLDEPDWQGAEAATGFLQRDPDEGQPATEDTKVRILFDDEAIYVGARMWDRTPAGIARRLTRRDGDSDDLADALHVGFDSRHDHLTGNIFSVTAAGTQSDAVIFNDSSDDDSWDAVWESAVQIDERGWTAELRIPFSQLRFQTGTSQTWGLNVVRYVQRHAEEDWWALTRKNESALASRFGHLTGLDVRGRPHLALLPYATVRGETTRSPIPRRPPGAWGSI